MPPQRVVEIGGHTKSEAGKRLSNFYSRSFVFDGVPCNGLEGFLQSLKCADVAVQSHICALSGREAKRAGSAYNAWKENQLLYWQGVTYSRGSRGYFLLISRAYDAVYAQDGTIKADLLALKDAEIWHSIGNSLQADTVLTESDMLCQMYRLRLKAVYEHLEQLF